MADDDPDGRAPVRNPPPRERVFSGMRPTGALHIGHLFGALTNWTELQERYDCIYCVVDLHALTTGYESVASIHRSGIEMVADWIACGIDPDRSILFRQSDVAQHSQLAVMFGMITPLSWLERVPTYKSQMEELGADVLTTFGFLGYPLLQTADIVLYKATRVPVGQDQLPHLELAREVVRRFNHLYEPVFPEPQALLTETPLVLGTDNRKMSKSYGNTISLGMDADEIGRLVGSMITDPQRVRRSDPGRPEVCNVFSYPKLFRAPADEVAEIDGGCRSATLGCVDCKGMLAARVRQTIAPISEARAQLLEAPGRLETILDEGAKRARAIATDVLREATDAMGLTRPAI